MKINSVAYTPKNVVLAYKASTLRVPKQAPPKVPQNQAPAVPHNGKIDLIA